MIGVDDDDDDKIISFVMFTLKNTWIKDALQKMPIKLTF